jgi:hypothetical protein
MLDYVVRRDADAARQTRKGQQPAIRGTFDGEFTWPILSPGPIYRAAFPDRGQPVATADIASLAGFGFPQAVIQAWAGEIPTLNPLQLEAINDYGVLRGEHLVASAPTSSGKQCSASLLAYAARSNGFGTPEDLRQPFGILAVVGQDLAHPVLVHQGGHDGRFPDLGIAGDQKRRRSLFAAPFVQVSKEPLSAGEVIPLFQ